MTYSPLQKALDGVVGRTAPVPATISAARDFIAATYRKAVDAEDVPLNAARGRILAQDIVAPADLPRFDAAAVDGYAVTNADLESGTTRLKVVDRSAAGHPSGRRLGSGEAMRI